MLPLRNEAMGFAAEGAAILFVSQAIQNREVSHTLLRGLYDLTKGEAKLASCILQGQDLKTASTTLGSPMRRHGLWRRRSMQKTGKCRQSDLNPEDFLHSANLKVRPSWRTRWFSRWCLEAEVLQISLDLRRSPTTFSEEFNRVEVAE